MHIEPTLIQFFYQKKKDTEQKKEKPSKVSAPKLPNVFAPNWISDNSRQDLFPPKYDNPKYGTLGVWHSKDSFFSQAVKLATPQYEK